MEFSRQEYWSHSLLQEMLPTQGLNPGVLHCGWILLPAEPPWKPKNTGVGSLSLLQQILPTQGLNRGLLHCKRILYQVSYQGNPNVSSMSVHLRQQDAHSSTQFSCSVKTYYYFLEQPVYSFIHQEEVFLRAQLRERVIHGFYQLRTESALNLIICTIFKL